MEEIERRFLCTTSSSVLVGADATERMEQGYLTADDPAVRVRRIGERYILTAKSGTGLVRREVETDLEPGAGRALLEMAGSRRIEKTRYRHGRWDIDVYHGSLSGLEVAECELDSDDEPLPPPPEGVKLIREVTETGELSAQRLAGLDDAAARRLVSNLTST